MKILITRPVPDEMLSVYKEDFEIVCANHPLTHDELLSQIESFEGLFVIGAKVDKEIIDNGKKLKVIANFGVGYDNIDWKYCTDKGIAVVNTPTQVTEATAEHTVALIMSTIRCIGRYDREIRNGKWQFHTIVDCDSQVSGSTLGILGFGRIGKVVCKKCQGLGMNVIYYDVYRAPEEVESEYNVKFMPFDEVLANADCITLHMPYFAENHHIFNIDTFKKMKPEAFFVNCARGPLVKEADLYEALKNHIIKGAGLDVFENEPTVYEPLKELDNIVMTPHIASATVPARTGMLHEAMSGIVGFLKGEVPYNLVNKEIFK